MHLFRAPWLCVLLLLIAGCASDPEIETFEASPVSLPHGGGEVALRWSTSGTDRIVIEPGIGEVEASGERTVVLTRTTSFTLIASAKGTPSATQRANVDVAPRAITGRVIDVDGLPVVGASVSDGETTVSTSEAGRFEINVPMTPYELTVHHPDAWSLLHVEGLTRDDVLLQLSLNVEGSVYRGAQVTGELHPAAGGHTFDVQRPLVLLIDDASPGWGGGVTGTGGAYEVGIRWRGGEAVEATLIALQATWGIYGMPLHISTFAHGGELALRDGDHLTGNDLQLEKVVTADQTVQFASPELKVKYVVPELVFESGRALMLNPAAAADPFTLQIPQIPTVDYRATLGFDGSDGRTTLAQIRHPSAEPWPPTVLEAPAPVQVEAPADGATVNMASALRWAKGGYDICRVSIGPARDGKRGEFVTASEAISLRTLRAVGVTAEAGWQIGWSIRCFSGSTVEDVAANQNLSGGAGSTSWEDRPLGRGFTIR